MSIMQRRDTRERKCRFCGMPLPLHRWFFCDNELCQGQYEAAQAKGTLYPDWERPIPRKPMQMCADCPEPCKHMIPAYLEESKLGLTLECRHQPGEKKGD